MRCAACGTGDAHFFREPDLTFSLVRFVYFLVLFCHRTLNFVFVKIIQFFPYRIAVEFLLFTITGVVSTGKYASVKSQCCQKLSAAGLSRKCRWLRYSKAAWVSCIVQILEIFPVCLCIQRISTISEHFRLWQRSPLICVFDICVITSSSFSSGC